jgi:hypothetical protein
MHLKQEKFDILQHVLTILQQTRTDIMLIKILHNYPHIHDSVISFFDRKSHDLF